MNIIEFGIIILVIFVLALIITSFERKYEFVEMKKVLKIKKSNYVMLIIVSVIVEVCILILLWIAITEKEVLQSIFLILLVSGLFFLTVKTRVGYNKTYVLYDDDKIEYFYWNKKKMSIRVNSITKIAFIRNELILYEGDKKYIIPKIIEGRRTFYNFMVNELKKTNYNQD